MREVGTTNSTIRILLGSEEICPFRKRRKDSKGQREKRGNQILKMTSLLRKRDCTLKEIEGQ